MHFWTFYFALQNALIICTSAKYVERGLCNDTVSVCQSVSLSRCSSEGAPFTQPGRRHTGLRLHGAAARRSAANAGSAVLTANGRGRAQT